MLKSLTFLLLAINSLYQVEKDDYLVCIHGFMGGSWHMRSLERKLSRAGWDVMNWDYPSRDALIADHGAQLTKGLLTLSKKRPGRPIHFVAHSMGSLVLLAALNHPDCPQEAKTGKIALIAPPLKGSKWGRWLNHFTLARKVAKDFSGYELFTKTDFADLGAFPSSLEKILIISGSLGFNPLLKGTNDGTLALSETYLSQPHDHAIVRAGHKTIVFARKTGKLLLHYFSTTQMQEAETSLGK